MFGGLPIPRRPLFLGRLRWPICLFRERERGVGDEFVACCSLFLFLSALSTFSADCEWILGFEKGQHLGSALSQSAIRVRESSCSLIGRCLPSAAPAMPRSLLRSLSLFLVIFGWISLMGACLFFFKKKIVGIWVLFEISPFASLHRISRPSTSTG